MAITDIKVSGKVFTDAGGAVEGATVALLETGTSTEENSTTTSASGEWAFTETSLDATYDVKISVGSSIRYILWSDEITVTGLDAASVKVRGVEGAAAPIYFFADQADDAGDGWRIQASASNTLAIGSDKASAGTIIDYLTITNGANAAASVVALGGDLTVGDDLSLTSDSAVLNMGAGNDFTITHDGTTGATLAGNPITITSAGAATWSTGAGVLTIDGDDGITLQTTGSGNVTVSEILDVTDATDSSDATGDTGALRTEGGASIAKKLYVGTDITASGGTITGPSGTWDSGGMDIAASDSYAVAGTDILSDSGGTMTLSNVDALDSTTEATIETAIDTLANLVSIGTITTGVWNGTDIAVADGGTGASTLTDGGVLLGSGTGAITAMTVLADGEFIVGDGTTDPVAESGATARASLGLGTAAVLALAQADQDAIEDEDNEDTYIPPDLLIHNPGVAKVWCQVNASMVLQDPDHGVSTVTDNAGAGDMTINFTTAFDSSVIAGAGSADVSAGGGVRTLSPATGSIRIIVYDKDGTETDKITHCIVFGDRA